MTLLLASSLLIFQEYGPGISRNASADTPVAGEHIDSNTTWLLAESPYIIDGDIYVDSNVTLTVESGVEVLFNGSYGLFVDGSLLASGTLEKPLVFSKNNPHSPSVNYWKGIRINRSGHLELTHANVSYGESGIVLLSDGNQIEHSEIAWNINHGLHLEGSSGNTFDSNTISYNGNHGLFLENSQNNTLNNNEVTGNVGNGIYLLNSRNNTISGNAVDGNGGNSLHVNGNEVESFNNTISQSNTVNGRPVHYFYGLLNQTLKGLNGGLIAITGSKNVTLSDSTVESGDGIYLRANDEIHIINCTVVNNTWGVYMGGTDNTRVLSSTINSNSVAGFGVYSKNAHIEDCTISHNPRLGISSLRNTKIINNTFKGNKDAVEQLRAAWAEITGNVFLDNRKALRVSALYGGIVSENIFFNNSIAMSFTTASDISITNNTITEGGSAVVVVNSKNLNINNNTINSMIGSSLKVDGIAESHYNHEIDLSNTAEGRPIYYIFKQKNETISNISTSLIILAWCENLTLENATVAGGTGIVVTESVNMTITASSVSGSNIGIELGAGMSGAEVSGNTINANDVGILIGAGAKGNTVLYNVISKNTVSGLEILNDAEGNIIEGNIIMENTRGISIHSAGFNIIRDNALLNNTEYGIHESEGSANTFYRNTLREGRVLAYSGSSTSLWDYESEGNHWGDYPGIDAASDGVGDTTYILDGGQAMDRYPSICPIGMDECSPRIVLLSHANNSRIRPDAFLNFSVFAPGLLHVDYLLDDGALETFQTPFNLSTQDFPDGFHRLDIFAETSKGYQSHAYYGFTVDGTPPLIGVNLPKKDGSVISSTDTLNISIKDLGDYSGSCQLDNGTIYSFASPVQIHPFCVNFRTEGSHTISIWVTDTNGNADNATFQFKLDSTLPKIALVSPPNSSTKGTGVLIDLNVSDANLDLVKYSLDRGEKWYNLSSPYAISTVGWESRNYTLYIHAVDSAGNERLAIYYFVLQEGYDISKEDEDGDGLPDVWETFYGLDPKSGSDAHLDSDSDGYTNLEEYNGGSNPLDGASVPSGSGVPDPWLGSLWLVIIIFASIIGVSLVLFKRRGSAPSDQVDWRRGVDRGRWK